MTEFKVGDKIKVLVDYYSGCMPNGRGPKIGDILTVVEEQKCTTRGNWIDDRTAEVTQVNFYGSTEFALVEVKNRFAAGDKVILANPKAASGHELQEGWIGYVLDPNDGTGDISVQVAEEKNPLFFYYFDEDELELLTAAKDPDWRNRDDIKPQDISDIARPVLEERKIGKVKMELFDEGFPNAVLEIARVMTWAAEHKGYKPHDWKNLPSADTEFSAAASRHKVKSFIQKVEGVKPLQRTDEESKISHLAHQAFNVLAELELVLTGVIK